MSDKKEIEDFPPVMMFKSTMRQMDIVDNSNAPWWKKALGYMVIVAPYFILLTLANEIPRFVYWIMGIN